MALEESEFGSPPEPLPEPSPTRALCNPSSFAYKLFRVRVLKLRTFTNPTVHEKIPFGIKFVLVYKLIPFE